MKRLRARNQNGWLAETSGGEYQANWIEYVSDPTTGKKARRHRSRILGLKNKMRKCDAERELKKIVEPLNNSSTAQPDGRVTFSWFVENKFLPARQGSWARSSRSTSEYDLQSYILPRIGAMTLEEIDISVLQVYLGKLAADKFSVWLVARCKTLVSSILEYACELEFIRRNPARSRSYRMPVCKPARKPVLSMAQILSLWNAITDQRDHLIVRVGTCCAVTANELLGLVWECVTPTHLIIRSMAYRGELTEWRVKRRARFRAVPITPTIHREFEQWRAMSENTEDAAMVFPNAKGTGPIWNGTFLQKRIAPIGRKLKIAIPVNFQVLRRSFATWNKASLKDAQSVLGHGDIATTANVYAQEVEADASALVANYEKRIMNSGKGRRVQ